MSYRNPKQFVDTQSGQYVREMQQSLSNTTNKTIQGLSNVYLENQKKIKEIANEAAEATSEIENAVFQTKSKNSTIQFDSLNNQLNKFGNLKKKDPTKLTNKERNFMASMENIGTTMKNGLANTTASAIAFKEQTDKGLGEDGGNDEFRNPGQYKTMSIMNGTIPGRKEASYEEDELGNVIYSVKVYDSNGDFAGEVINGSIEKTMFVSKVPDLTKKKTDAIELVKAELSLDSKFAEAYAKGDTFGLNKEGQKVETTLFDKAIAAKADNIYRELSDNDLSSYWNNRLRPKRIEVTEKNKSEFPNKEIGDKVKNDKVWAYDIELTEEQRKEFKDAFILDIKGELGAVRAQNKIMQTKTVKTATNKTGKASELEKRSVKEAKKFAKLQKWDGKGIPPVTTISSAINKDIQARWLVPTNLNGDPFEGKEGKWVIEQKNGEKRINIAEYKSKDFQRLADQLGFDFAGKKNKEDSGQITSENTVIYPDNVGAMTEEQQNAVRLGKLPIQEKKLN